MPVSDQPINKVPQFLLRLLGISGPDHPSRLLDFVQGQVDLLPWWLASLEISKQATLTSTASTTGFVTQAAFTVPADKRWIVVQAGLRTTPIAGGSISAIGAVRDAVANDTYPVGNFINSVTNPSTGAGDLVPGGRPGFLLLGPQFELGAYVASNSAHANTMILSARVVEYPA